MEAEKRWSELRRAMASTWPVLQQTKNRLVLGSEHHQVRVEHRAGGTGRIHLGVPVIERPALSPERALMVNADLTTGSLCLVEGRYMLRHTLALTSTTISELDRVMGCLVNIAAAVRAQLSPLGPVSTDCFRNYQD